MILTNIAICNNIHKQLAETKLHYYAVLPHILLFTIIASCDLDIALYLQHEHNSNASIHMHI